jgi:hypothetical protein
VLLVRFLLAVLVVMVAVLLAVQAVLEQQFLRRQ